MYYNQILGLDMDGTIIVPSSGKVFPKDYQDWKYDLSYSISYHFRLINDNVIPKLKEYFEKGYKIVLFSNQVPAFYTTLLSKITSSERYNKRPPRYT